MGTPRSQPKLSSARIEPPQALACPNRHLWAMTLIELIVVVAIIAVLAAIIFPAIANARQSANKIAAVSQERQLGMAATLYSNDFDGFSAPSTNYALDTLD